MLAPALVDPMGIAEDADGRIEYLVAVPPVAAHALTPVVPTSAALAASAGDAPWAAVALLALGLIVAFAIGLLLTR